MPGQASSKLSEVLRLAVQGTSKSINAVAREAGVPQPVLQRFMSGQRSLTLESAERLCAYLGLGLGPLFSGTATWTAGTRQVLVEVKPTQPTSTPTDRS